jgi:hypothetical protein
MSPFDSAKGNASMDELCKGDKFFEPFYWEIVLTLSLLARELGANTKYKIRPTQQNGPNC